MDGQIDVESTYGKGTCFTIKLAAQKDGPDGNEIAQKIDTVSA
jgi:signal transduction histidine kinase